MKPEANTTALGTDARYIIRCKSPAMNRALLMRPDGYMTRLRVHAARIPAERLDGCLAELRELNPDWIFEAVV